MIRRLSKRAAEACKEGVAVSELPKPVKKVLPFLNISGRQVRAAEACKEGVAVPQYFGQAGAVEKR